MRRRHWLHLHGCVQLCIVEHRDKDILMLRVGALIITFAVVPFCRSFSLSDDREIAGTLGALLQYCWLSSHQSR